MRPFITLITIVALLVHAGLGCCAHHSHAAEPSTGETANCNCCSSLGSEDRSCEADPANASSAVHALAKHGPSIICEADGAPSPPRHCSEAHCVFVGAAKSNGQFDFAKSALTVAPIVPWLQTTSSLAPTSLPGGEPVVPTGRLHLFYQIFLI